MQWRAQTSGGARAKWCYDGTIMKRGEGGLYGERGVYGFGPPRLGVGDMTKIFV